MLRRTLAILVLACGCGKASAGDGDATGAVLAAWQKAGLAPTTFEPVDTKGGTGARCRGGKVRGIDATLCEFDDEAAAKRAETASLGAIKDATGLALAQGKLLLVLADRTNGDPSGKSMNEVARAFRTR